MLFKLLQVFNDRIPAGTLPFGAVVHNSNFAVLSVSRRDLPDFAGADFDTLDFVVRFAHTYSLGDKCNTFLFVGYNTVAPVEGDIGQDS